MQRHKIHKGGAMKIRSATFFMSRGAEKKVAKIVQAERNEACFNCRGAAYFIKRNRLVLICDACKEQRTAPQSKGLSYFYKNLY